MGCCAVGTQGMPLNTQRSLHTALCGGTAPLPVGEPRAGALPAAQCLLCVCSFQLLSISLNGPIQGHSCASETPAAWTQSAERGVAGPAHENVPARPASRSPRLFGGARGLGVSPEG